MLPEHPRALTVGAITDPAALRDEFTDNDCDVIELRLDALSDPDALRDFCARHHGKVPLLLTPRAKEEGGASAFTIGEREELLRKLLPYADAIDIELANHGDFRELIDDATARGIAIVLSSHDFKTFDHVATVERLAAAQRFGATIAKAAVTLTDPVDLTLFESLAADLSGQPVSIMGMGSYGPVSRLLAAQHGSRLNYGYLGSQPTAPGQWPARLLKEALARTPALP